MGNDQLVSKMNISEAIVRIKAVGACKARAVPMPGQHVSQGQYQIEVFENSAWNAILEGVPSKQVADGIIQQATNRVICG